MNFRNKRNITVHVQVRPGGSLHGGTQGLNSGFSMSTLLYLSSLRGPELHFSGSVSPLALAGLGLPEIRLPLSPEHWNQRCVCVPPGPSFSASNNFGSIFSVISTSSPQLRTLDSWKGNHTGVCVSFLLFLRKIQRNKQQIKAGVGEGALDSSFTVRLHLPSCCP